MSDFFDRLDDIRRRWDVLRHPFYERWSQGSLSAGELSYYAGQYRHAVVALAEASAHAGDRDHAEEERSHIGLWDGFVRAVGGDAAATAAPATAACAAAWGDPRRDRARTLAALYSIEAAQPAISETKRDGLIAHYGAAPHSEATRYFDVHAVLDRAHAERARQQLSAVMQPADESRLLAEGERVLRANWQLLDGVQERASAAA